MKIYKKELKKAINEVLSEMLPPDEEEIQQSYGHAIGYKEDQDDPTDVGHTMLRAMKSRLESEIRRKKRTGRGRHNAPWDGFLMSDEKVTQLETLISDIEKGLSSLKGDDLKAFVFFEAPSKYWHIVA